jgi:transcriptional regulator with XRE-family HTH domain
MISEELIGRRIRQLRLERKMTQSELARAAGLTTGYISNIENSSSAPPVSTLHNIARGMGTDVDAILLEQHDATGYTLVRRSERQEVAREGSKYGYYYEPLAHQFPNRHMDPYMLTIPAGVGRQAKFAHAGEEMIIVVEGNVNVYLDDEAIEMGEGDCLYFNSSITHSLESIDGREVKYLAVLYSPDGSTEPLEQD